MLLYEIDDGRFCLHNIIAGIKYVMAKQKSSTSLKERRKKNRRQFDHKFFMIAITLFPFAITLSSWKFIFTTNAETFPE